MGRFPTPWTVEKIPGGFKVLDANGQSLAYVYSRETKDAADIAKVLTEDEARRIATSPSCQPCSAKEAKCVGCGSSSPSSLPPSQAGLRLFSATARDRGPRPQAAQPPARLGSTRTRAPLGQPWRFPTASL